MRPLFVKIGGSLAETGRLKGVLEIVVRAGRPAVVVPGGGPFADAVRSAQARLGLSDADAHRLAIRAMEQMGHVLCALEPALVPAATLAAMRRACAAGRVPVWMAYALAARDQSIPQDWTITSDGLAARLAERLGGSVVLVKSRRVERSATAAALAAAGVVDPVFAEIVERAGLEWRVLGPGEEDELGARLTVRSAAPRGGSRTQAWGGSSTPRR